MCLHSREKVWQFLEQLGIKNLAEGPNSEITLLTMGFEPNILPIADTVS